MHPDDPASTIGDAPQLRLHPHSLHTHAPEDLPRPNAVDSPIGLLSEAEWDAALMRIRAESLLLGTREFDAARPPRQVREPRAPHAVQCLMRLHPVAPSTRSAKVFRVMTRNISRLGVSLIHGRELREGRRVILALETGSGSGQIAPASVAWCRRIGAVSEHEARSAVAFEIGLALDGAISEDLIHEAAAA